MRRLFVFAALFTAFSCARAQEKESMELLRARVYDVARVQAVYMDSLLMAEMPDQVGHDVTADISSVMAGPDRPSSWCCPRTFQGDTLVTSDIGWWTSGFYPGVLWQIFEKTEDPRFMRLAVKHTLPLAGLLDRETDHDIGFQLMSSFGKMARIFPYYDPVGIAECNEEELSPKAILSRGAAKLAARFIPSAGVIRSWNWGEWNIPVIIDNMMNLELLMAYGNSAIAEKHALTTARNHFRDDGTCFHLVDYADDGSVLGRQTVQGFSDDSAWARGQAWALYGYAMMGDWSTTHEDLYVETALKLAEWIMDNLPEDGIPYWDFSQTDYKDASAAAIIAAGLLRLWEAMDAYTGEPADPNNPLLRTAERILRTLASPEYLAEPCTNGGFLLKHSVGNLPGRSEVDVPLTYADYYFLEALDLFP